MDKTYTIIPDFMLDYDLTLTEVVVLSVIHGFCQDGESDFHGSYNYLARKAKLTRSWAIKIVDKLIDKGLVRKETREANGVRFLSLRSSLEGGVENTPVVYKIHRGGVENTLGGGVENTPNNISIENIDKGKNNPLISPFDFFKALRGLGVTEQLAREWMAVRKTKRLTNTWTAFDQIAREIAKTGRPAEDCVRLAVENSWGGFKAEWMKHETNRSIMDDLDETIRRLNDGTYTG
jgi:DNA-binding Lrp family transcriptional regulator